MFNFRFLLIFLLSFLIGGSQSFAAAEDDKAEPRVYKTGLIRSAFNAPQTLKAYDLHALKGAVERLPLQYSLAHSFEGLSVYDQQNLGACTAHAGANALWALQVHLGMEPFDVSRLHTYHKTLFRTGKGVVEDMGASLAETITTLMQDGFCHENLWSYDDIMKKFKQSPSKEADEDAVHHKVLGELSVAWVGSNLHNIRLALKNGYALPFGMAIYKSFCDVGKDGRVPLPRPGEHCLGGHAMTIIGYDDVRQALEIRNSWGLDWGNKGHAWLPYDLIKNISEVWAYRHLTGAPESESLLEGIEFKPSTSTIPQDDNDIEGLADQVEETKL